jgi:hypothetical protein
MYLLHAVAMVAILVSLLLKSCFFLPASNPGLERHTRSHLLMIDSIRWHFETPCSLLCLLWRKLLLALACSLPRSLCVLLYLATIAEQRAAPHHFRAARLRRQRRVGARLRLALAALADILFVSCIPCTSSSICLRSATLLREPAEFVLLCCASASFLLLVRIFNLASKPGLLIISRSAGGVLLLLRQLASALWADGGRDTLDCGSDSAVSPSSQRILSSGRRICCCLFAGSLVFVLRAAITAVVRKQ